VGCRLPLDGFTLRDQRDPRNCFHAERPSECLRTSPIAERVAPGRGNKAQSGAP
jgi:hypothetical protein